MLFKWPSVYSNSFHLSHCIGFGFLFMFVFQNRLELCNAKIGRAIFICNCRLVGCQCWCLIECIDASILFIILRDFLFADGNSVKMATRRPRVKPTAILKSRRPAPAINSENDLSKSELEKTRSILDDSAVDHESEITQEQSLNDAQNDAIAKNELKAELKQRIDPSVEMIDVNGSISILVDVIEDVKDPLSPSPTKAEETPLSAEITPVKASNSVDYNDYSVKPKFRRLIAPSVNISSRRRMTVTPNAQIESFEKPITPAPSPFQSPEYGMKSPPSAITVDDKINVMNMNIATNV